jgi:hypothetical protein
MKELGNNVVVNLMQIPMVVFLLWAAYRKFISSKPLPRVLAMIGRVARLILAIVTLGLLAGCSNSDPLAVATGPLFPLNLGHWQPSSNDLASPPVLTDR